MSNRCFGCGTENEEGLHLQFSMNSDHSATAVATIAERYAGEPGIVHGGIQATLLDEVLCKAVQYDLQRFELNPTVVTGEMCVKYLLPCPTRESLTLAAHVENVEWPWYSVAGEIRNAVGDCVSRGTARWKVLGNIPAPDGVTSR